MASHNLDLLVKEYVKLERQIAIKKEEIKEEIIKPQIQLPLTDYFVGNYITLVNNQIKEEDIVRPQFQIHPFQLPRVAKIETPVLEGSMSITQFTEEMKAGRLLDVFYEITGGYWIDRFEDGEL